MLKRKERELNMNDKQKNIFLLSWQCCSDFLTVASLLDCEKKILVVNSVTRQSQKTNASNKNKNKKKKQRKKKFLLCIVIQYMGKYSLNAPTDLSISITLCHLKKRKTVKV